MLNSPAPAPAISPVAAAAIDHVEFHVKDLDATVARLTSSYGFEVLVPSTRRDLHGDHLAALLGQNNIRLLIVQALDKVHPAWLYTQQHGDGVASIALKVKDVLATYTELVDRGAIPVRPPVEADGCVIAAIRGFGDVVHTLVQRSSATVGCTLPGLPTPRQYHGDSLVGLRQIDHFAVCVPPGELAETVRHYTEAFGMPVIFEEQLLVGRMGMDSAVVQNDSGAFTLTLIAPAPDAEAGQIGAFLDGHQGAGVQHVAFASDDITCSVRIMQKRGTVFLRAPDSYYDLLGARLTPVGHTVDQLRELNILVDEDHHGQLFQIFTRSEHERNTVFFEIIERNLARSFGSNNVRALYEAVELQRSQAGGA